MVIVVAAALVMGALAFYLNRSITRSPGGSGPRAPRQRVRLTTVAVLVLAGAVLGALLAHRS